MKLKGRHWVGIWLLIFLGAAAVIVTRQRAAILAAGRLAELREHRQALEATRAELTRAIARASSREVLVPKMERAGLHLPSDLENVPLRVDRAGRDNRGGSGQN
ncbi:MAG: hypothetical protein ACT4PM_05220 [Gemmatimonadales bacterium]